MPNLESIIAVTLAGLALSITPGPSMLYVLSHSIGQSKSAGLMSAVGLALGGVILAVATALGLAVVFNKFDWLVLMLRYIGSIYLIWLGISMIRDAYRNIKSDFDLPKIYAKSLLVIFWQGVFVEIFNPKTVLFFALFLPPFVNIDGGQSAVTNVQLQLLILGALVPLTAVPSDIVVAYMGGAMAQTIKDKKELRYVLSWIGGLILIGISLNLHFEFI